MKAETKRLLKVGFWFVVIVASFIFMVNFLFDGVSLS